MVIPHLTITESAEAPLDEIAARGGGGLCRSSDRVARLEVLVEGPDGRWRTRWRLPLGRDPQSG